MSETTEIEYALTVNIEDAVTNLRRVERLIFRILGLFSKLGVPPEIDAAIHKIQRLIVTMRMLQITTTMLMSSNPITAAFGLVGIVGLAAEFGSGSILEGY